MNCELCGKTGPLYECRVEGSVLKVCATCAPVGSVVKRPAALQKPQKRPLPQRDVIEQPVADFAEQVRHLRESRGMTQKDFAKLIGERESVLQKMETQGFVPSLATARKLERQFKVSLVETVSEEPSSSHQSTSRSATLGDFIRLKE